MSTWYVSNAAPVGSDTADGLTPTTPFLTISKVQGVMARGDTVLLNRGCTWRETLTMPASLVVLADFGAGDAPVVTAGEIQTGWSTSTFAATTFQVANTTQPNMIWGAQTPLTKNATSRDVLANGEWIWVANVLYYRRDAGNPDAGGVLVEAGARSNCIFSSGKTAVTLRNLTLTCGNDATFGGALSAQGNAHNWTLENCNWTKHTNRGVDAFGDNLHVYGGSGYSCNGFALVLGGTTSVGAIVDGFHGHHNGTSAVNVTSQGAIIQNCNLHSDGWNTALAAHSVYIFGNVNGGGNGTIIQDNVIWDYFSPADSALRVSGNTITVRRNVFYNADVAMSIGDFEAACNGNVFHHNLCYGMVNACVYAQGAKDALYYNNTFVAKSGITTCRGYYSDVGRAQNTTGAILKNNVFSGMSLHLSVQSGSTQGFVSDYNLYDNDSSNSKFNYYGTAYNFGNWKIQTTQDSNSTCSVSPSFSSSANSDFRLTAGSPAINTGLVIAGVTDGLIAGPTPDMGWAEAAIPTFGFGMGATPSGAMPVRLRKAKLDQGHVTSQNAMDDTRDR